MPNRAYASLWVRDFGEANLLSHLERFLSTVPLSAQPPGFTELVIRAVEPAEAPLAEFDLRGHNFTPPDIVELAREHHASDVSYEISARWDLWVSDLETAKWAEKPERLTLFCFGPDYDQGTYAESGHFLADVGFEHFFTGHAGLLPGRNADSILPEDQEEARFLLWMSQPENAREYYEKTRENIRKLMDWMREAEQALPIERTRLWSEGEENFEARLDEILAVR
jgi:hypothetical protein